MFIVLNYLLKNDPALLERRMRLKEKEKEQKIIVKAFRLPFILGFIIPGFDYRFNWSEVPNGIVIFANIMVIIGYFIVFLVFRENSYTSRIVEVDKDQKVISSGPYSIVRHPMYTGTCIMFLFTSLALGSFWGLIVFAFLPVVLIFRIFNEEKLLLKELPGYKEYCEKTRYRLIPYIW
jgi:protein-S-isoprenylcysteine O-methyltransferase Ste14